MKVDRANNFPIYSPRLGFDLPMAADSTTDSELTDPPMRDATPATLSAGDSSALTHVPSMRAETGYDESEMISPLRFSGYVCLILGMISAVALLGLPALVVPGLAILIGLIALRPSQGPPPLGKIPAQIGLLLAIGFGTCGFGLHAIKQYTMGNQAKYFTRQYIDLVAIGQKEMAIELGKSFNNRFNSTMPLKEFYQNLDEQHANRTDRSPDDEERTPMQQFDDNAAHQEILKFGRDADWKLAGPVVIYKQFGIDRAEVLWTTPQSDNVIQFLMQYLIDGDDVGQWHVDFVQIKRELLVAESVL